MASVGTVIVEVDANTAKLVAGIKKSNYQISKLQKTATAAKKSIANFAKAAAGIYVVAKAFSAAKDAAYSFVNTAASFEQYESTLKSITGSSIAAKESMAWVEDFAKTTPFNIGEVTQSFIQMKAYGLDPLDGTMTTLGDTAAAMGKGIKQAVEAVADAVQGENERLKEFGIKAKKQGEQITYNWSDSQGKMRDITIKNNKDIIQSTLNAIWNEKYGGAMEEQAKTWNGLVANLQDTWTIFQKNVMSEGLLTYLKAMLITVADIGSELFGKGVEGAKNFSDYLIGGIKSVISAFGSLYDIINGIKLAFTAVKAAFTGVTFIILDGVNTIAKGWELLWVGARNLFKGFVDATGKGFANMANYVIKKINAIIDTITGLGTGVLEFLGFEGIGKSSVGLVEYNSVLKEVKVSTEDLINTDWSRMTAAEALTEMDDLMDSIINEEGSKKAAEIIATIEKNVAKLNATEKDGGKNKKQAKDDLDAIIKKYGETSKASSKAGKAAKKALKDAKEAAEDAADALEDYNQRFAGSFADAFDGILHGDMISSFQNFFDTVGGTMMDPFMEDMAKKLSGGLSDALGGLSSLASGGIGAAITGGMALLSATVLADTAEEPPVLGEIRDMSDSLSNALSDIYGVQYPMLEMTRDMRGHLETISNSFGNVSNSLLRSGIDIGGGLVQSTSKDGFLFGGSTNELYGTSIDIDAATVSQFMNEQVNATMDTVMENVSTSWYGSSDTSYRHNITNISDSMAEQLGEATNAVFETLIASGDILGINTNGLLNSTIDIGQIDTTGMTAEEVSAEIEGRFGAQVDAISEQYFGVISEFQRGGEGLAETLYRVTVNFEQVGHSLELIGKSVTWRTANIIEDVAGGLDALSASLSSYSNNFFTDAEQYSQSVDTMTKNFASLGLELPSTNAEFRTLVEGFDTTTDAGATLFAEVISLADGFNDMTSAADELAEAAQDAIDKELALAATVNAERLAYLQSESAFLEGMFSRIEAAYTGSQSYLNSLEKSQYLGNLASSKLASGDSQGYFDTLFAQLGADQKTATTSEEYALKFERYIGTLQEAGYEEKTTTDVVDSIELLIEQNVRIEDAISRGSFQGAL